MGQAASVLQVAECDGPRVVFLQIFVLFLQFARTTVELQIHETVTSGEGGVDVVWGTEERCSGRQNR